MSKKNIDKFFQEKFKDFEEVPDEKVWTAIEASLNGKKKKRVIPIWWKLGGVAAALVLGLIVFNQINSPENDGNIISDTQSTQDKGVESETENKGEALSDQKNTSDALVESATDEKEVDADTTQQIQESVATANQNRQETQERNRTKADLDPSDTLNSNATILTSNGGIEKDSPSQNSYSEEVADSDFNNEDDNAISTPAAENLLVPSRDNQDAIAAETENQVKEKQSSDPQVNGAVSSDGETLVAEQEEKDGEIVPQVKKKSILEAVEEQPEEEIASGESGGRWSAGPNIAPVYFNGFGEGSPVHSSFAQNTKSGNTNLSYGLSVAYQVNRKLRIRSGVNKVNYGYDTDDVAFSSALQASTSSQIKNIDYSSTAKNLVVKSESNSFSNLELASDNFALDASSASSTSRDGVMAQQFGYLEIPLELDYALIESKLGLNLVGGISSYFLLDNSVSLTSGELTTEIGEANNINTVNFSTNLGFGVNYRFTPKVRLNIEPVFKYQLNTFSNVSGDFRPYSIGVYSGLNYRF